MVRYLDIWDTLNLAVDNAAEYREILSRVTCFSSLQHLRIVVDWGLRDIIGDTATWNPRTTSWFDENEWKQDGKLKEDAVPKMRSEDIEKHWPEYEVLMNLKAQKFTLAASADHAWAVNYLEFDKTHGAYPEICKSMRSQPVPAQAASSSANLARPSMSPQVLELSKLLISNPTAMA